MTHTPFTHLPAPAAPDGLNALLFGVDDDEDVIMSPQATDIFGSGRVGLFEDAISNESILTS